MRFSPRRSKAHDIAFIFDPSGNRNETYAGGTFPHYDNDVVTWTQDEAARAIFFHGREMIPSFGWALT